MYQLGYLAFMSLVSGGIEQPTPNLFCTLQVDRISDLLENRQNSMIIGARKIVLQSGSVASQLYGGLTQVIERQRHRYEVC